MTLSTLFLLLVIFQFKHFIADYPLQTEYMLGKFKNKLEWIKPLLAHVAVHGLFTLIISFFFTNWYIAFILSFIDMIIHFCMDRLKASPKKLGQFKLLSGSEMVDLATKHSELYEIALDLSDDKSANPTDILKAANDCDKFKKETKVKKRHNKLFWVSLGFDQMIHHLTDLLIVYIIFTH